LPPRFIGRKEEQPGGAIEPGNLPLTELCFGQAIVQGNLRGSFGALAGDIKQRDGLKGGCSGAEAVGIGAPAGAEGGNDPCARDDDALGFLRPPAWWK
jgi:hypothetical protein